MSECASECVCTCIYMTYSVNITLNTYLDTVLHFFLTTCETELVMQYINVCCSLQLWPEGDHVSAGLLPVGATECFLNCFMFHSMIHNIIIYRVCVCSVCVSVCV